MKKEEFLRELEKCLSGISEEERTDALAFYRSYFEDAGEENEEAISNELESPQKVAESILRDLGIDVKDKMTNDSKYYNTFANRDEEYFNNVNQAVSHLNGNQDKEKEHTKMIVWIAVIAVLTSPIWLTVLLAAVSVVLALVSSLFAVAVAAVAVMASLLFVGFLLAGIGISIIFSGDAAVGIGLISAGCLVLALGILALVLVTWLCGVFVPWAVKGIWKFCKKLMNKRKGCAKA